MFYKCRFYSVQVSIAGQPGGVEAARVKIRVSSDSCDFNLTWKDSQVPSGLIVLWRLWHQWETFFHFSYPSVSAFLETCKSLLFFLFGLQSSWHVILFGNICISIIFNCVQTFVPSEDFIPSGRLKNCQRKFRTGRCYNCKCWQVLKFVPTWRNPSVPCAFFSWPRCVSKLCRMVLGLTCSFTVTLSLLHSPISRPD